MLTPGIDDLAYLDFCSTARRCRAADSHRAQRVHLVGIAGSGMRSLADVLVGAGWSVSGSDLQADTVTGTRYQRAARALGRHDRRYGRPGRA